MKHRTQHEHANPSLELNIHTETETTRLRKILAGTALLVAGSVGLGVAGIGAYKGIEATHHHSSEQKNTLETTSDLDQLEYELEHAYEGPIKIAHNKIKDTHKTVITDGAKRGVIEMHFDGARKNEETAHMLGPGYFYGDTPRAELVAIDKQPIHTGAVARWESDQKHGDVIFNPRLANFMSAQPKTLDYKFYLTAEGYTNNNRHVEIEYPAGDVFVTGDHSHITKIEEKSAQGETPRLTID